MLCSPAHLYIHQRIVGDVDRIGNFPEPFANCGSLRVSCHAAATGEHYDREEKEDADCLVDAVRNAGRSSDARN